MAHEHNEDGNVVIATVEIKGVWWKTTTYHCTCGQVQRSTRERV